MILKNYIKYKKINLNLNTQLNIKYWWLDHWFTMFMIAKRTFTNTKSTRLKVQGESIANMLKKYEMLTGAIKTLVNNQF